MTDELVNELKILNITPAKDQTPVWRKNQDWYKNGKSTECEKYQIPLVENIIQNKLNKTHKRINLENSILEDIQNPLSKLNGFDYTENFDGYIKIDNNDIYFNLKMICGRGGAQNRSLRETYHFIKSQLNILIINTDNYFINILDGNECERHIKKFNYLKTLEIYKNIKNIYVGDLYNFKNWWDINFPHK